MTHVSAWSSWWTSSKPLRPLGSGLTADLVGLPGGVAQRVLPHPAAGQVHLDGGARRELWQRLVDALEDDGDDAGPADLAALAYSPTNGVSFAYLSISGGFGGRHDC